MTVATDSFLATVPKEREHLVPITLALRGAGSSPERPTFPTAPGRNPARSAGILPLRAAPDAYVAGAWITSPCRT